MPRTAPPPSSTRNHAMDATAQTLLAQGEPA
ncbi:virulence protein SciE type, partial [Xanthomonas perforans]